MGRKGTPCDELRDLVPAYSIGATDPQETAFFEAYLEDCPEVAVELAEYADLVDRMHHALPAQEKVSNASAEKIFKGIDLSEPQPNGGRARIIQYVPQQRDGWSQGWVALAAVCAIVILTATNIFWAMQSQQTQQFQQQLVQVLANQESQPPPQIDQAVSLQTGQTFYRQLTPTVDGHEGTHAALVWNRDVGSMYAFGFPQPPDGMAYQLWLVTGDQEISMGSFIPDANGVGTLFFEMDGTITDFEAAGISLEPIEGSNRPTTPHLVIGKI